MRLTHKLTKTDLFEVARTGNLAQVKKFLNEGADVNAKFNNGATVLMRAAARTRAAERRPPVTGADVDAKYKDSWTSLMIAALNGHVEVVRALLGAGADVNAKDNNGATSLSWAARKGQVEVVRLLVEYGVEVKSAEEYFQSKNFYQEMVALSRWVRRRGLVALCAE